MVRIKRLIKKLFDEKLEFRLRIFNMLALGGIIISFMMAVFTIFQGGTVMMALMNAAAGTGAILLTVLTNMSGRCQLGYTLTVITVFLITFPVMFFISGGYRSGMPCFFLFAVIFTVCMLDGAKMFIFTGLEFVIYSACIFAAYFYPSLVTPFGSEAAYLSDVYVGFAVVALVLGSTVYFLLRLYKKQQKALDERNLLLAEMNRSKTAMLADMSHEMRTPLTVVSVDIQRAADMAGEKVPEATELLDGAQDEIMRLARLVNGLLSLASVRESVSKQKTDYAVLIHHTVQAWSTLTAKKNNSLTDLTEPGLPPVFCDPDLFAEVISNLLENANRHTSGGEIRIKAVREGDMIKTTVSDTGEGIPEKLLPDIFSRGVSGSGGTGYGLYIVRMIIEASGGNVTAKNSPEGGAVISFTVPVYAGQT